MHVGQVDVGRAVVDARLHEHLPVGDGAVDLPLIAVVVAAILVCDGRAPLKHADGASRFVEPEGELRDRIAPERLGVGPHPRPAIRGCRQPHRGGGEQRQQGRTRARPGQELVHERCDQQKGTHGGEVRVAIGHDRAPDRGELQHGRHREREEAHTELRGAKAAPIPGVREDDGRDDDQQSDRGERPENPAHVTAVCREGVGVERGEAARDEQLHPVHDERVPGEEHALERGELAEHERPLALDPDREHADDDRHGEKGDLLEHHPRARLPAPEEVEQNEDERQRNRCRLAEAGEHEQTERERQSAGAPGGEITEVRVAGGDEEERVEQLLPCRDPRHALRVHGMDAEPERRQCAHDEAAVGEALEKEKNEQRVRDVEDEIRGCVHAHVEPAAPVIEREREHRDGVVVEDDVGVRAEDRPEVRGREAPHEGLRRHVAWIVPVGELLPAAERR